MRFAEGICVGIFKSCCDRLIGLLEVLKGLCMSVREHISKARCPNSTKFSARVTRGIHPRGKWSVSLRWNFRGRKIAWNSAYVMQRPVDHDRRASVLFLAVLDPRVGYTMDVLSPFISVLCHSDSLFHGESCPRLDVVHPGRAWSSSPACTWHRSLHSLSQGNPLVSSWRDHSTPNSTKYVRRE